MPTIELKPISAEYSWFTDDDQDSSWHKSISFRVCSHEYHDIILTSGDEFNHLDPIVTIQPDTVERSWVIDSFAVLFFFPQTDFKAGVSVQVRLPTEQIDELISAGKCGHLPSTIWLSFSSYDILSSDIVSSDHCGGSRWDNAAHPRVAIDAVHFTIPLVTDFNTEQETDLHNDTTLPTRGQLNRLLSKVAALEESFRALTNAT